MKKIMNYTQQKLKCLYSRQLIVELLGTREVSITTENASGYLTTLFRI
jgi:hypothetical protein